MMLMIIDVDYLMWLLLKVVVDLLMMMLLLLQGSCIHGGFICGDGWNTKSVKLGVFNLLQ